MDDDDFGPDDDQYEAELEFNRDVAKEVDRLRVRGAARIRLAAENRPPMPDTLTLANALTIEWEDSPWRIDGVMPREGICLLSAPQKAGKTTFVGNLIRSLVDGDKFLDGFQVEETCRVTLIDTELGERRLYKWLGDQGITQAINVRVISLRGNEASLDPRDPAVRAEWARLITGSHVVILDVVGPVLAALGLDEADNADVGAFWTGWRTLLADAGVPASLLVHHTGHDERRAIGASSWLRYPDAIWKIEREDDDPTSPRYFSAYGRDVDVWQGALGYNPITRHLTYTGQPKNHAITDRNITKLVELLTLHGAQNFTNCESLLMAEGLSQGKARATPPAGVRDGVLVTWKGDKNAKIYGVKGVHHAPPT
jgi:hypothetical protein